jgi:D-alanine-D-alanine ligase
MKILIVYNCAKVLKKGLASDLICEQEIEIIVPLVADSLRQRGYEITTLEVSQNFWVEISAHRNQIDLVLNLAEGFGGCNTNETLVPAILEALEIPFTGASFRNMTFTMDKEKTNLVLSTHGIPIPKHRLFRPGSKFDSIVKLQYPLIVKPVREEASVGITCNSVVSNAEALEKQIEQVFRLYKQPALVEEFIEGREISVGIIGNGNDIRIFEPLEFTFDDDVNPLERIRSYEYKWGGKKEMMRRARLDIGVVRQLIDYTRTAYIATDCQDYARMDYRLTKENKIFLLEVNYNPGIGPNTHGLNNTLTMMASFDGFSFESLIEMIILTAKKRYAL